MTSNKKTGPKSPRQLEGALFILAKEKWLKDWGPAEVPTPLQWQLWDADPRCLPIQHHGLGKPHHAGSSVKLDLTEREISKAFRPRPFLIVSNSRMLKQGFAWVCLCSSAPYSTRPDWIVPLPEFGTFCFTAKLHVISTGFLDNAERRELLSLRGSIQPQSAERVRTAILRLVDGDFAPRFDPAPTGSVVRGAKGGRLVIGRCDVSNLYKGAKALATMVALERGPLPSRGSQAHPTIVPLVGAAHGQQRKGGGPEFVDLVRVVSQHWFEPPPLEVPSGAVTMGVVRTAIAEILKNDRTVGPEARLPEESEAGKREDEQLRELGKGRHERRLELIEAEAEETLASELALEALPRIQPVGPFEGLIEWLRSFVPPTELLGLAPATVRGEGAVRREGSDETGAELLAADLGVQVEIAFENRDAAPVWVVVCEQEQDGSLSFVPGDDLAAAPRVPPGDALTFNFMPPPGSVVRVAAIALRQQPSGDPATIASDPGCLHGFGIVATARFTLRVGAARGA